MIYTRVNAECGDFHIEISSDISAIQSDWERLEAEGSVTPFQTRAWLLPFYGILAPQLNATPLFVLVRDKLSRRPMMMLPLCARRHYGVTAIEFADLGVSDYNAPAIATAFTPTSTQWKDLWRTILAAFDKGAILRLEKMPHLIGNSPNPFVQHSKKLRLMGLASWGVALPTTFAEYNSLLSSTFTKELSKKFRRVAKRGEIKYAVAQTPDEKRIVFDILVRQRQARCDEMGRFNILSHPAYRRFYQSVAVGSSETLGNLGMLQVGGEIVGTALTLNRQKAVYVIMSTFEGGEWKSSSLGNVVMQSAIEHSIGSGVNFFDFTIGNEGYKQHFGALPSPLYAVLEPLTPIGSLVTLIMTCGMRTKGAIKQSVSCVKGMFRKNVHAEQNPY